MPQQTSFIAVLQSVSAPQVRSPPAAGSHTCFDDASDTRTHAWPCVVSHIESAEQKIGHALALSHSLLPLPKSQQSSPRLVSQSLSAAHAFGQADEHKPMPLPPVVGLTPLPQPLTVHPSAAQLRSAATTTPIRNAGLSLIYAPF